MSSDPADAPAPAPFPEKLTCIDVFSGIGGITLGLAPYARPVQYCEIDRYCQSVLLQRMGEDRLERAPIHSDIRNLFMSPAVKPDMICGGFPCQDISSIGLQKGIVGGERSSMFYEVMRIVDSNPSINIVFLENVGNILNCGIKEVVDELDKRGFTLQWQLRKATSHGAPHVRARWFMLACRGGGAARVSSIVDAVVARGPGVSGPDYVIPDVPHGNVWRGTEPLARVSFRPSVRADPSYDDHWSSRCQTLGNAVVPPVVRFAFTELAQSARRWTELVDLIQGSGTPISELKYPYPESAIVHEGLLYAVPGKRMVVQRHDVEIIAPGGSRGAGNEGGFVKLEHYPTPRRGITHASTLTERSVRDLPTILVNCTATADYLRSLDFVPPPDKALHSVLVPNVPYISWMMGYPAEWTRISHESGTRIPMPLTRAAVARANRVVAATEEADEEEAEAAEEARAEEGEVDEVEAVAAAAADADVQAEAGAEAEAEAEAGAEAEAEAEAPVVATVAADADATDAGAAVDAAKTQGKAAAGSKSSKGKGTGTGTATTTAAKGKAKGKAKAKGAAEPAETVTEGVSSEASEPVV
jgi:DNA (cytosine-5)-methyltransferase 1